MTEGPYHDKISYATNTNLLNWTDSEKTLVKHASVPGAIYKNGTIYVYFVDVSEEGKPEQIRLIKSTDGGKTWSDKEVTNLKGIGSKVPVDPAPFVLDDGRIRLYYFDISTTKNPSIREEGNKMYSAISDDSEKFTKTNSRFNSTINPLTADPSVIKLSNGTYLMFYKTKD